MISGVIEVNLFAQILLILGQYFVMILKYNKWNRYIFCLPWRGLQICVMYNINMLQVYIFSEIKMMCS